MFNMMQDLRLRKNALSLFFGIAFAIPIVATVAVVLVAGRPSDIVVKEISAPALIVVMAMVHSPTIAAIFEVPMSTSGSSEGELESRRR